MDMNEIYSPSNLISKAIKSAQNDPFFVILVGSIQIMITTAHWTCLGLAISSYQTFLPEDSKKQATSEANVAPLNAKEGI